jgi:hypothetical protein
VSLSNSISTSHAANQLFDIGIQSGAIFDATDTYRFLLWRVWNPDRPRVCWIMLNPSNGGVTYNDNTVKQCISFSKAWGFGGLEIVNLFALISTDPKVLRHAKDPVGEGNDQYIIEAAGRTSRLVCAWGAMGVLYGRDQEVIKLCRNFGELWCIGKTKDGHPWHPLRKSLDLPAIRFQ